ncbi:MAG: DUF6504 family protein [Motilibacteraceae bacterium]
MTRRYDDPVDVRRSGTGAAGAPGAEPGAPAQFVWRGRLYLVREVLGHWVEVRPWWRAGAARALLGTDTADASQLSEFSGALALAAPPVAHAGPFARPADRPVDEGEREVWRVEAGAGRLHGTGVYDLCLDPVEGTWSLARALD